jgi:hypothetical protein
MGKCKEDIWTEHAPLIHDADDITFQTEYTNGTLPAEITDYEGKNVQRFIEDWLSKTGLPVKDETPGGAQNNGNLYYTTQFEFIPDSLEVYLSCNRLNGDQSDPDRDYDVITTGPDAYKAFQLRLNPNRPEALNRPPLQYENFKVDYNKRVTFNTKGGN